MVLPTGSSVSVHGIDPLSSAFEQTEPGSRNNGGWHRCISRSNTRLADCRPPSILWSVRTFGLVSLCFLRVFGRLTRDCRCCLSDNISPNFTEGTNPSRVGSDYFLVHFNRDLDPPLRGSGCQLLLLFCAESYASRLSGNIFGS